MKIALLVGCCFVLMGAQAAEFQAWKACAAKGQSFHAAAADSTEDGSGRKYAPDRIIDVQHLKLDFTPDFDERTLTGTAVFTFSPIAQAINEVKVDAIGLEVMSVKATQPLESHHADAEHLVFQFENELPAGEEVSITIQYSVEPQDGLYFRTPAMGYKEGDTHLWTQGEPQKHRYWFPSYDYPNERFTTEVICRVPEGMTVLSNGKLLSQDVEDGLVAFHWLQDQPHVNYLVSVVAGYLEGLKGDFRGIPLAFYTPPSDFEQAANSFQDTKEILEFFEAEIGVPYPWDKYYNVCVQGYPYGGMENTSVTTLTTRTLFSNETENIHTSRHLDAHEVAHQWFGDLVTCKDWTHLWLNEGFATYYTELYEEHKFDRDHLLYRMHEKATGIIKTKDDKPIAWRGYSRPWDQFDYRAYPKGAWVLHMLRSQLGPDLFRKCIRTYLERHRGDVAVTEDLNSAVEDVSGRSLDRFFDQWVYHGGVPKLVADYKWDAKRKQARITISQTQKVTDKVLLFQFPLPIRFHTEGGEVNFFDIEVTKAKEDFYFDLGSAPTAVRVDPDYTVLADLEIKIPNQLVESQAQLKEDMMGRLLAVKMLGKRKDKKSLEILKDRLQKDPFHGVRLEAAKALGERHTPESQEALSESLAQDDARVRKRVVESLGKFYNDAAQETLEDLVNQETNPEIIAAALAGLCKFPGDTVNGALLAALERDSFRHRIAMASIEGMRKQGGSGFAEPLLAHLREKEANFVNRDFGKALRALGFLGQNLENEPREEVRQFISDFLDDPREQLTVPAIEALGALEDSRSISVLEPFLSESSPKEPRSEAARKAIEKLNGQKKQGQELKDLRKEVLDLQKEIREMRESLEKIQKAAEPEEAEEEKDAA